MFGRQRGSSHGSESAAIVRRLVITDARVIGFLPGLDRVARVLPALLTDWAATMADFVTGPIGVVADWSTWDGAAGGTALASLALVLWTGVPLLLGARRFQRKDF